MYLFVESNIVIDFVLPFKNEIPPDATLAALETAKKFGTLSIFNPAPVTDTLTSLIAAADIVCPNEQELAAITGMPTTNDEEIALAAKCLREKTVRMLLLVTFLSSSFYGINIIGIKVC